MTLTYIPALALHSVHCSTGLTSPSPLRMPETPTASSHFVAKKQRADGAGFDPSLLGYGHAEPWHWQQSELGGSTIQFFHHQLKVRWCGSLHSITSQQFFAPFEICTAHMTVHLCTRLHSD